jgi:hypothetical protein
LLIFEKRWRLRFWLLIDCAVGNTPAMISALPLAPRLLIFGKTSPASFLVADGY